jgi:hypothetical protein
LLTEPCGRRMGFVRKFEEGQEEGLLRCGLSYLNIADPRAVQKLPTIVGNLWKGGDLILHPLPYLALFFTNQVQCFATRTLLLFKLGRCLQAYNDMRLNCNLGGQLDICTSDLVQNRCCIAFLIYCMHTTNSSSGFGCFNNIVSYRSCWRTKLLVGLANSTQNLVQIQWLDSSLLKCIENVFVRKRLNPSLFKHLIKEAFRH